MPRDALLLAEMIEAGERIVALVDRLYVQLSTAREDMGELDAAVRAIDAGR